MNITFVWLLFAYEQATNIRYLQMFFEWFLTIPENSKTLIMFIEFFWLYAQKKLQTSEIFLIIIWMFVQCMLKQIINIKIILLMFIDFTSKNIHNTDQKTYFKHYTCKNITITFACIWTNYKHLPTWNVLWMFRDYTCRPPTPPRN